MREISIEFPGVGAFTREWLETHADHTQEILAQCKGQYPRCHCRDPGLPLYIARRHRYYLARIPNSGPDHAPFCPSYEPDRAACGWGIYSDRALSDSGEGRVIVKLGVPLLIRGGCAGSAPSVPPTAVTEDSLRDAIALPGLLHLLWERAGFNRWSPRMRHRRHYRQIHKYVLEAAEAVQLTRQPLTQHLYVPEPFVPEQALEIEARRQQAFREMSRTRGGAPLRILVLGRVRAVLSGEGESGLRLSHLPNEFVIRVEARTLARLHQATEFAWIDFPALHPEFQLIVLLTMRRADPGRWQADELTGLVTTEEFIPALSMQEALLAKRLVAEGRHFYKPLPYDASPARFANFLLTDCGDEAVPLEIVAGASGGGNTAESAARLARVAEYEAAQRRSWLWDLASTAMSPVLPPAQRADPVPIEPAARAAGAVSSHSNAGPV